jgi:hypothetical protein
MDRSTMRDIERQDRIRRAERDQADIDAFIAAKSELTGLSDALPNSHRDIRASRKWHDVQSRNLRGVASIGGRVLPSDGTPTVAVYNFYQRGVIRIADHAELRRSGRQTRRTAQSQTVHDSGSEYFARVAQYGAHTELASE